MNVQTEGVAAKTREIISNLIELILSLLTLLLIGSTAD